MKTFNKAKKQKGNYLLSIGIGIMIVTILSVWGFPKIKSMLVEGAIPSVAEAVQTFISRTKVMTADNGTTPYTGLSQITFARAVKGTSLQVGDIAGQGSGETVVRHGLGGGDAGTVLLATTGATFSLTFAKVSDAACPGLAASLQRTVDSISINGKAVKTTGANNVLTLAYIAGTASMSCVDGDENTFLFTINRA